MMVMMMAMTRVRAVRVGAAVAMAVVVAVAMVVVVALVVMAVLVVLLLLGCSQGSCYGASVLALGVEMGNEVVAVLSKDRVHFHLATLCRDDLSKGVEGHSDASEVVQHVCFAEHVHLVEDDYISTPAAIATDRAQPQRQSQLLKVVVSLALATSTRPDTVARWQAAQVQGRGPHSICSTRRSTTGCMPPPSPRSGRAATGARVE
mmetsp:Transcript_2/g.3  ORF Transcript_2/g.3 Transcript_2/m.3 type:complete len:205 (-) Transcript_2:762-1376(-)